MRTWAHDIGRAIGCGGHLIALRRTAVGKFEIEDAVPFDDVDLSRIIPLSEALPPVPLVRLTERQVETIRHGQAVGLKPVPEGPVVGLTDEDGIVVGMGRVYGTLVQPECVIPSLEE
jgi:tRNA pseudouridine55 synthase